MFQIITEPKVVSQKIKILVCLNMQDSNLAVSLPVIQDALFTEWTKLLKAKRSFVPIEETVALTEKSRHDRSLDSQISQEQSDIESRCDIMEEFLNSNEGDELHLDKEDRVIFFPISVKNHDIQTILEALSQL